MTLRNQLIKRGSIFQSTMDTEVIIHLIALSQKPTLNEKIIDAVSQIEGAFSLVIIHEGKIIALRDPNGVRPLVLGRVGDAYVVASETCALDISQMTKFDCASYSLISISFDRLYKI